MSKNLVIVFIRSPQLGTVKTRLSATCKDDFTLELYILFIKDLINTLKNAGVDFAFCGCGDLKDIVHLFGVDHTFAQVASDLGTKMAHAFAEKFAQGYEKILLIGSDTPHISQAIFAQGFVELSNHDCVLGPSSDGGYYLIGFNQKSFSADAFLHIEWSTPSVLSETLHRLSEKNIYLLEELNDIDDIDDLKDFYETYRDGDFSTSETIQFLKESEHLWKQK